MFDQKTPPANANAERAVLGAAIRDPEIIPDVGEVIGADSFSEDSHQKVWRVIASLTAEGRPVDLVAVHSGLKAAGWLEDVGGAEYLASLWDAVPTGANAVYHAGIVREHATRRAVIHAANEILRDAYSPTGPAGELLALAERKLFDLGDAATAGGRLVSASEMTRGALDRIDGRAAMRSDGTPDGIATGFRDLDQFAGPLRPGNLIVLGARPGGGKTALALNVAANVASRGGVLFFSQEMPHEELADRLLSMGSNIPASRLGRGDVRPYEAERLASPGGDGGMSELRMWVDDTPAQSGDRMMSVARRAVRRLGVQFVVVDYLQLMRPENPRENRTQQVGMCCRRVWQLARECGVPVLLLSQLNREIEGRSGGRPTLADLRESGEIEQHAHKVLLLYPHEPNPQHEVWRIGCVVAKNRNGPTGEITLDYRRPVLRFEDSSPA